jgi:hypothetical protein
MTHLRDAIDQDVFRIDDDQYNDDDFQKMSLDELNRIKIRIGKKVSNISAAIKNKKADDNGKDVNAASWYRNHRAALSINERVSGFVKNLISERLRMIKTTGDCFMRHAKADLPVEVYERILNAAQQEISNLNKTQILTKENKV